MLFVLNGSIDVFGKKTELKDVDHRYKVIKSHTYLCIRTILPYIKKNNNDIY